MTLCCLVQLVALRRRAGAYSANVQYNLPRSHFHTGIRIHHKYHDILHVRLKSGIPQHDDQCRTYRDFQALAQAALLVFLACCDWTAVKWEADLDIETTVSIYYGQQFDSRNLSSMLRTDAHQQEKIVRG